METPLKFVFYAYTPSLPAAIIFIILFALSTVWHIKQLFQSRTWYFLPFIVGCLFETVGYVGRAISSTESPDFTKNPYIIQSVLLLLGPTLFAASIYMILGRLIHLLDAGQYSLVPARWITKLFVLGDVLSFFAQGAGGGLLTTAKAQNDVTKGENVILGGLGIQILFFSLFILVTAVFHVRIHRNPTQQSLNVSAPWVPMLHVLYIASFLILVRSVFRVVEYFQGSTGLLMTHEYFLYLLDALPMFTVCALFNWMHPGKVISRFSRVEGDGEAGVKIESRQRLEV
ncbi:hypothetical protein PgNI_05417 [Pyricularia grisea]|uniref:Uncharacterized protein n=1 Tax=Pyricularia grisea TaxID=148305 RepID=A0A6P8B3U2_PYRGI|nr:hypothetical protein PgNI_05417 [Pyricularia grisea]TLD09972.1 hypothetical protein PgNI_05417 [Pyricularia grisea]